MRVRLCESTAHLGQSSKRHKFVSENDERLHFGLDRDTHYDRIEVLWPGSARERFDGGTANRVVVLKEGTGKSVPEAANGGPGHRKSHSADLPSQR